LKLAGGNSVVHVSFRLTEVLISLGIYFIFVGLHSVAGIGTCCGLVDLGMKLCWGRDFLHLSRPGVHPVSCAMGTRSLSQRGGVKGPGCGIDRPFSSSV
jgi:hypothetical protein